MRVNRCGAQSPDPLATSSDDEAPAAEPIDAGEAAPPETEQTEPYDTSGSRPNEPRLSDIHQGDYGDCYLLASLGAMANNDSSAVKNMIRDNHDGTYTVTLYQKEADGLHNLWGLLGNSYAPVKVTVSAADIPQDAANEPGARSNGPGAGDRAVTDSANQKRVIWPAVVEAAYAKMNESPDQGIQSGYTNIGHGGAPASAMRALTGHDAQSIDPGSSSAPTLLEQDFKAGKLITITTPRARDPQTGAGGNSSSPLAPYHAYTVTNVYEEDGVEYVVLNNPWGGDGSAAGPIPVSELPKISSGIQVGTIR
ncbi:MAG: C2 family cysteine protease [Polyangiaceae bacterium]|nr:C2 family cysteine protease [Polyangiaceae bacterium]